MKKSSFLWSLLPFWLFVLVFKFGAGLHYSLLSTLGSRVLPIWAVGLAVGGAAFLQLVFDVPAGVALDKFGYARMLRVFTFVFILGATALFLPLTAFTFFVTLILAEAGWLFFGPGTTAYVLSKVTKETAGKSLGFFHAIASAGTVLATAALPFVVNAPLPILPVMLTVVFVCALIAALCMPREKSSVHEERKVERHEYYVRRTFLPKLFKAIRDLNPASGLLILHNFAASLFYGSVWFAVPLVMSQDAGHSLLGISLSVFDLAVVVLGSFLGTLADKYDRRRLVFFGLLVFAVAATVIGFELNLWFLVLGFLATAGDEMAGVSLWAWLDELDTTHEQDGLVNGAVVVFEDLGWTIGPIVAGFLFVAVGPAWTITLCATPIVLAWIISSVFLHHPSGTFIPVGHIPRRARHKN